MKQVSILCENSSYSKKENFLLIEDNSDAIEAMDLRMKFLNQKFINLLQTPFEELDLNNRNWKMILKNHTSVLEITTEVYENQLYAIDSGHKIIQNEFMGWEIISEEHQILEIQDVEEVDFLNEVSTNKNILLENGLSKETNFFLSHKIFPNDGFIILELKSKNKNWVLECLKNSENIYIDSQFRTKEQVNLFLEVFSKVITGKNIFIHSYLENLPNFFEVAQKNNVTIYKNVKTRYSLS